MAHQILFSSLILIIKLEFLLLEKCSGKSGIYHLLFHMIFISNIYLDEKFYCYVPGHRMQLACVPE